MSADSLQIYKKNQFLVFYLLEKFVKVGGDDDFGAAVGGFAFGSGVCGFGCEFTVTGGFDASGVDARSVFKQQFHN